jgi:mannose-6-phosphate isomerase-like protein (cupin superfamily)
MVVGQRSNSEFPMSIPLPTANASSSPIDNEVIEARKKFPAGRRPPSAPIALDSGDGARHIFGAFGVHWKIDSADSGGRFSVVHHPIAPRSLVAPLHRHHREDEYSYVLTGKFGALLGEEVVTAGPGTWIFKPRGQWHTFWNAGDTPCEIIEVISPGGFEDFFRELATAWGNPEQMSALGTKYELDFDFASVPRLCERFGLTMSNIVS